MESTTCLFCEYLQQYLLLHLLTPTRRRTNAIHNTDISLPVPARVAAGLGSVGVAMTANLAVELVIARVLLNFVDVQVIRELIIFASVAVVVDYCLESTRISLAPSQPSLISLCFQ